MELLTRLKSLDEDEDTSSSSATRRQRQPEPPKIEIEEAEMYIVEDESATSEEEDFNIDDSSSTSVPSASVAETVETVDGGQPVEKSVSNVANVDGRHAAADFVIEMDILEEVKNTTATDESFMDMDEDDLNLIAAVEKLEREKHISPAAVMSPSTVRMSTSTNSTTGMSLSPLPPLAEQTEEERREEVKQLKRLDPLKIFPDVRANGFHTVAFFMNANYKPGDNLQPHPASFQSRWEADFVPMPCSRLNFRIIRIRDNTNNPDGSARYREERIKIWERIQEALSMPFMSVEGIQVAMKQYLNIKSEFKVLKYAVDSIMTKAERENFFGRVLPCIQTLVLDTERMITCAIPLLKKFKNHSVSFSQKQIACLLANAFFSTFPSRLENEDQFPSINFIELFQCNEDNDENSRLATKAHKLRCILNYFARVADDMPNGVVTFTRKSIRNSTAPNWESCGNKLTRIIPLLEGTIEDDGVGMLQVDFANKVVGGGVLRAGAVQEEILFVIYPELLVARLLTEKLTSCEALLVTGCERFCRYTGYARNFRFDGDFFDTTPYDNKGRRCGQIVAIDALYVTRPVMQFHPRFLGRELNKAYVGFSSPTASSFAVATGKWGCGAFNGDPQLKAILQLVAASRAGRDVVFFTFNDQRIQKEILEMHSIIKDFTIAEVWKLLTQYYTICCTTAKPKYDLYEFISRFASSRTEKAEEEKDSLSKPLKTVPITHFYSKESKGGESPSSSKNSKNGFSPQKISSRVKSDKDKTNNTTTSVSDDKEGLSEEEIASILALTGKSTGESEDVDLKNQYSTPVTSDNDNSKNDKKLTLTDFYK